MSYQTRKEIRNFAIIAHVDHGKTTLVDAILRQAGVFRQNEVVAERVMDSNDLERERGITIFSKNASYTYQGVKCNIVDTPGHADFGGEVERILKMVDGVVLLVDAAEGPLPQTKFVLKKSLELGLKPIVIINKIDRPDARALEVHDKVLELFINLGASEEQCDFPYLYASSRLGFAKRELSEPEKDLKPFFDMILEKIPAPQGDPDGGLQMLVTTIVYSEYVGRIGIGRITRGTASMQKPLALCKLDGRAVQSRASKLFGFEGLKRVEIDSASVGDIIGIAGFEDVMIGETISDAENPEALPPMTIDEPTLSMTFGVNTSPLAGQEGKYVTTRHLKERLEKELLSNLSLRVEPTESPDTFVVSGRGELHLGILIETMRREGYELQVGKPKVIFKQVDGKLQEPYEQLILDLPTDCMGPVIERLGSRKGEMVNMQPFGNGQTRLEFSIPSRCLLGFRTEFLTLTRGEGIMHHVFAGYGEHKGETPGRSRGVLWATDPGDAAAYGIYQTQDRGVMFIDPKTRVYTGMIVGENSREGDLGINVTKTKPMSNMRSSSSDEALTLIPPRKMSLENCLEFIEDDELVEVTPKSIRLRKKILDATQRKRMERAAEAV